jgi:hypothetical protein
MCPIPVFQEVRLAFSTLLRLRCRVVTEPATAASTEQRHAHIYTTIISVCISQGLLDRFKEQAAFLLCGDWLG